MWFILALATAISEGIRAAYAKHVLKRADEYIVTWTQRLIPVPAFIILAWLNLPDNITPKFVATVAAATASLMISSTLYMKALRLSPMYLTMPYLALTPLFMLVTSRVMVGEVPSVRGVLGIILVSAGIYWLNFERNGKAKSWLEPLKAIRKEKGSLLMLIVAFLFSIGANLDKIGVTESNFFFYSSVTGIMFSIAYAPAALAKSRTIKEGQAFKNWKHLALLAVVSFVTILFHNSALSAGMATYVIPIKRLSILVGVVAGALFFKEKKVGKHAAAATLMIAGAALISTA
ncbi:EamA family transporter [Candidatus Woesearchaeota archaeon]|nr:MAG: EamA family transporter [Candidatus Woesearchaeota archaeon]